MAEKYLPLNEVHRRTGVALSTLRRKIKEGALTRVDGKGITVASLKKLYGEIPEHAEPANAPPSRSGEREGSDTPSERGSAPRSEGVARGGALPPEQAAELAALRARCDTLQATLDHERTDREKERAGWQSTITDMTKQMLAIKGADYARDMAAAKLPHAKPNIIDGEASEPSREENPSNPPGAGRGAKRKAAKPEPDHAPRPAPGGLLGFFARFRR